MATLEQQMKACPFKPSYCLSGGKCSFHVGGECTVAANHHRENLVIFRNMHEEVRRPWTIANAERG